jgi:RimJ/RimL family protein N-acetyltransferase
MRGMPRPPTVPVELTERGLRLRPFVPDDLPALLAAFADPEIVRWNPGPPQAELPDAAQAWLYRRNDWSDRTHASWAVAGAGLGLVGSVSVHRIDLDQQDAEIGYWIAPCARGRGAAARAVDIAARFVFDHFGLRRIMILHAVDNPPSCGVATTAGFRLEGTLRQSHRYPDGLVHDEHLHARLSTDPRD